MKVVSKVKVEVLLSRLLQLAAAVSYQQLPLGLQQVADSVISQVHNFTWYISPVLSIKQGIQGEAGIPGAPGPRGVTVSTTRAYF